MGRHVELKSEYAGRCWPARAATLVLISMGVGATVLRPSVAADYWALLYLCGLMALPIISLHADKHGGVNAWMGR